MGSNKGSAVSGRDHYHEIYKRELDEEAEWLRRTAQQKVDSVERLTRNNALECKTVLELGCGTGAVITECQRRRLFKRYMAADFSLDAIEFLRRNSTGIETFVADVTNPGFVIEQSIDVIVLSHVLEHLERPLDLLRSIQRLDFRYLIAEVPLDDLLLGRAQALFKKDRTQNRAGHVQFFTATSFRRLISESGLDLMDERRYLPSLDLDTIRFVCRKNGSSRMTFAKMVAGKALRGSLGPVWSYVGSAHFAVLCRKPKTKQ